MHNKFLLVLALLLLFTPQAASAFDMGLSPARVDENMLPGQQKTIVYSFVNASPTSNVRIQVSVLDWYQDDHGNMVSQPPGSYKYSASDWLEISPAEFVVKPRQTQLVRVTYSVPAGTKPGEYLTSLIFRQRVIVPPVKQRVAGQLVPEGAIASVSYIDIAPAERKPTLESMKYEPASGDNPPAIEWTIKNDGNSHVRPSGNIQIKDAEDKTVVSEGLKDMPVVLRESHSLNEYALKGLKPGKYKALLNLDLDPDNYKLERGSLDFEITAAPPKTQSSSAEKHEAAAPAPPKSASHASSAPAAAAHGASGSSKNAAVSSPHANKSSGPKGK